MSPVLMPGRCAGPLPRSPRSSPCRCASLPKAPKRSGTARTLLAVGTRPRSGALCEHVNERHHLKTAPPAPTPIIPFSLHSPTGGPQVTWAAPHPPQCACTPPSAITPRSPAHAIDPAPRPWPRFAAGRTQIAHQPPCLTTTSCSPAVRTYADGGWPPSISTPGSLYAPTGRGWRAPLAGTVGNRPAGGACPCAPAPWCSHWAAPAAAGALAAAACRCLCVRRAPLSDCCTTCRLHGCKPPTRAPRLCAESVNEGHPDKVRLIEG